jgi:acyl-CoA synthetase (AMP-forming)/AMP-acid ligase II
VASEPIIPLDPAWPKISIKDAVAALTAPGMPFEMETVTIRGVPTRTWKNAVPTIAALVEGARAHGDRLATINDDERVSYAAQYKAIATLAHRLQGLGVGKGDRVAFAMRNLPEWPVIFFAITSIGAIAVPLNAWWTGAELTYGIKDSGAKVLIMDGERWARMADTVAELDGVEHTIVTRGEGPTTLESLIGGPKTWADLPEVELPPVELAPDDDATIFYTSGTTGNPKGALGTHRNLMTNIMSGAFAGMRSVLRRGEAPPEPMPRTILTVIPLFHVTACSATLMGAQAAGHTMIFLRKWDAIRAMEIIEREKVNLTGGVPTIAWQLIEHPDRHKYDLSSLEAIAYGGAPSAPELVKRIFEEFGAMPGNGWGMTETMATVTSHSAEDYLNRPTSAGPPVPVADLEIRADDGVTVLPTGEVGELWARGPMIVKGYWNKPEATAATFIDGWVRTGDLARLDEEGFVYIVDRAKDMVIRGGENIYSTEVENVLYAHPAVTDCALIGIPHRTLGEEPAAVVHLCPGCEATEAELQAWVKRHLAPFKMPVAIRFVDETLPRNANGKILKKDLGALFADRVEAAA